MAELDPKARAAALEAFVAAGGGSFVIDMPSAPFDAALQAYEAKRTEGGWLTIDSAPKDGTAFIAYSPMHGVRDNVSWGRCNRFDPDGYSPLMSNWTHWRPSLSPPTLPSPPPPPEAAR